MKADLVSLPEPVQRPALKILHWGNWEAEGILSDTGQTIRPLCVPGMVIQAILQFSIPRFSFLDHNNFKGHTSKSLHILECAQGKRAWDWGYTCPENLPCVWFIPYYNQKILLSPLTNAQIWIYWCYYYCHCDCSQREWMVERIESFSKDSELWYTIGLIHSQFSGLMMGYNSAAPQSEVNSPENLYSVQTP